MTERSRDPEPAPPDAWSDLEEAATRLGHETASVQRYHPPAAGPSSVPTLPLSTVVFAADPRRPAAGQPASGPAAPGARAGAGETFQVAEQIGRGGMGIIYRAVQASLGREVAVKQIAAPGEGVRSLFFAEAQITGRLEHANIVPVHVLAQDADGTPVLAMKLVRGVAWSALLRSREGDRPGLDEHLRILMSACHAVAFAHREGFLHRDLKPDNIMVGEFGQVFVMDWGLAVGLDRDLCQRMGIPHVSDVRTPAGTPVYMAPELALGDGTRQGVRTDVYLLGACLHEVLTGRRRHQGDSDTDTIHAVLRRAVQSPPFAYAATVPRELGEIANRAIARDPADRYPSVEALRGALEAFLQHREAHAMSEKGRGLLATLRAATDAFGPAPDAARADFTREIHRAHSQARFAFERALEVWEGAPDARQGLVEASRLLLEHALVTVDLPLAERLLPECGESPPLADRVEALRARLVARDRELVTLRDAARRLDWSAIAGPLGAVFVAAGVLGGGGVLLTRFLLARGASLALLALFWMAVVIVCGGLAVRALAGARVPDSLLSPRVVGLWGAVAAGCLAVAVANELHGVPPFHHSNYSALIIGIGFAAMAFQARRWLLAPAALFFAGGILMAAFPGRNLEIMAALWLLGIGGVGVAIRLGATIDPREAAGPGPS